MKHSFEISEAVRKQHAANAAERIPPKECRRVIANVDERLLLLVLNLAHDKPDCLRLPASAGLPPDARVVGVHYSFNHRCLQLMLEHPSFDPVLDGALIPIVPGFVEERLFIREPQEEYKKG